MSVYFFLNMKKKKYGVNVREHTLTTRKKNQILKSPQDLQQYKKEDEV